MKLNAYERDQIRSGPQSTDGPTFGAASRSFQELILRVLLSIDERLADTNDFYLQNQEERAQNQ